MNLLHTAFVGLTAIPALTLAQPKPQPESKLPSAAELETVKDSNAFAVDLYAQLRSQPGNLFFSPESISTAFAMAYAGARGQTASEMQHVFHFSLPPVKLHPAMGTLLARMNGPHRGYTLRVADALWAEQDAGFLPSYLKLVQSDYSAGFHRVNFKSSPEIVRNSINQWVEEQTNHKIQNLIAPGVLTPATRLVLTNAIYFKGDWLNTFEEASTQTEQFHLSLSQFAMAPLMHRTGSYSYYDGGTFQALDLPYQGDELSMDILLPRSIDGLPALEQSFTASNINNWLEKLEPESKVILTLPRFTMTQQLELNSALSALGMPQAFGGSADFSGMTGKHDFTISAAIHKAYIDVNEQGTEAAAATSIVMSATAARIPFPTPPPIVFRADHPFLFMIRDTRTGAILFLGRVTDPTK